MLNGLSTSSRKSELNSQSSVNPVSMSEFNILTFIQPPDCSSIWRQRKGEDESRTCSIFFQSKYEKIRHKNHWCSCCLQRISLKIKKFSSWYIKNLTSTIWNHCWEIFSTRKDCICCNGKRIWKMIYWVLNNTQMLMVDWWMRKNAFLFTSKIIPIYAKNQKEIYWTGICRNARPWFRWWCSVLETHGHWRTTSQKDKNENCEEILNQYCQKMWKRIQFHAYVLSGSLSESTWKNMVKNPKDSEMRRSEMTEIHQWLSFWCILRLMVMNCICENKKMILFSICQRLKWKKHFTSGKISI